MAIKRKMLKGVKDFIYWFYVQYMLVTCAFDMEPWEKVVMHSFTATTLTMSVFTVYLFIPTRLNHAFQFFLHVMCGQREPLLS
uniref:Serine palmitoyltransferase small subunit B n=1 Tax=Podarcis muralis TaxID=64176 RepID=A0A670I2Q2_PODMU